MRTALRLSRPPAWLLVAVTLIALATVPLLRAPEAPLAASGPLAAVTAVAIPVSDVERAADFYARVLFFERVEDTVAAGPAWDALLGLPGARARVVRLRLGDEHVELVEFAGRGRPRPPDSRSHDRWFQHLAIVVSDMDQAHLWLVRHGVEGISPAPQRLPDWNPQAGGIRAFYFRDPDGHPLELLEFPADKGDPRWQRAPAQVFLGIDHTAIVVGDTARSLRFYRDRLGLRVAGQSENHGPEQERLNAVAGARLRITTLRAPAGPGVELLEYLAPRDGRPIPADLRPHDLAAWRTVAAAAGPRALADLAGLARGGTEEGVLVRDPDGHLVHVRPR